MVSTHSLGSICSIEPLEKRQMLAASWGPAATLIGQDRAAVNFPSVDGRGQTIVVLDTGVDYWHPALRRASSSAVIGGWDFIENNRDIGDYDGHGSMVTGILAANSYTYRGQTYRGLANGARIIMLTIEDGLNPAPDSRVKSALAWVITNKRRFNITAVNLSFGDGEYVSKTSRPSYGAELATLNRMNVFVAAASGNDGANSAIEYPAADPNVVSVGSVGSSGAISSFTNAGPALDLLAPGERVPSTTFNYDTGASIIWPGSGTSFAAPYVVASAVLLRQINPSLTNAQVLSILKSSGTRVRDPDSGLTFSRLNIDAALRLTSQLRLRARAASPVGVVRTAIAAESSETILTNRRQDIGSVFATQTGVNVLKQASRVA